MTESRLALNAFRIENAHRMRWDVSLYKIVPTGDGESQHADRGAIKNAIWNLRKLHRDRCRGYGSVVDVDEQTVAIPAAWDIPAYDDFAGFSVTPQQTLTVSPNDPEHHAIVSGLLRDGVRKHFKDHRSGLLGDLWQDYGDFCQMPDQADGGRYVFCRKFLVAAELLRNGWVLQTEVSTACIDGWTIADYYSRGAVADLARAIVAKREGRLTRRNTPIAIRAWHDMRAEHHIDADVRDICDPDQFLRDAKLETRQQQASATSTVVCQKFGQPAGDIRPDRLRLILDTQMTREDHAETILDPRDRADWYSAMRAFMEGADIAGNSLCLSDQQLDTLDYRGRTISPPAITIATANGTELLPAPVRFDSRSISQRSKRRIDAISRHGFVQSHPINPVLACPGKWPHARALRLLRDLNYHLENIGAAYRLNGPVSFSDAHQLRTKIGSADSALVVLPRDGGDDLHDRIKRQLEIPSQCIMAQNTLGHNWVDKSWQSIREQNARYARRIERQYKLTLMNLLVKLGWVPFAPAQPFHYGVHIGIDVGGKHNNKVMACACYGLGTPDDGLLVLPHEIEVNSQQAEPIPSADLYNGLRDLVDDLCVHIRGFGGEPDFSRVLFLRDGVFLGKGDHWNEMDAISRLAESMRKDELLRSDCCWTGAEISKRAARWRMLRRSQPAAQNPIVGECIFPFRSDRSFLLATTGQPYLPQGTASPLLVTARDVIGNADIDAVADDIVWAADMCFTKPDQGMSLPWALHVADTGALQKSRAYLIQGVTV